MLLRFCLCVLLATAAAPLFAGDRPVARGGVIDLSSCSLTGGGAPSLDGEWEFYSGVFLDPSADPSSVSANPAVMTLPELWNSSPEFSGKGPDPRQFGTYRLRIRVPSSAGNYHIHVPYMYSAYRLYVNGALVAQNGVPGTTKESTRPMFQPLVASFHAAQPVLDLRIHIANFHDRKGGIWETPRIAADNHLLNEYTRKTFAEAFLLGMLFIFGLYHICMHCFRRDERTALYFGLFCVAVGVRTLFIGNLLIYTFFPDFPWLAACRVEYVTYFLMPALFMLYSIELFPLDFHRIAGRIYVVIACAASVVVLVTPKSVFGMMVYPIQAFIILGAVYVLWGYVIAAMNRRSGSIIAIFGLVVFFAAVANDLLFATEEIRSVNLLQYGFMVFVFAHSVNLSYIFAQAFEKIKTLSKALEHVNNVLEDKVHKRTFELTEKNRLLEQARTAAEKDLKMAVKVQMSVMPRTAPVVSEWDIGFRLLPMSGVSGDFYDFYSSEDGLKGVALFDVSGHGISSGLVTMLAKWIIFKTFMQNLDKPLSSVFALLGHMLPEAIGSTQYFLTGSILRFSGDTVEYANAGHPDLLHLTPSGLRPVKGDDGKKVKGRLLGCRGIPSDYESITMRVEKDEYLILMTDGLLEAENGLREQFGYARLDSALSPVGRMSAQKMCDYLVGQVAAFRGSTAQNDDLALIVLRRR